MFKSTAMENLPSVSTPFWQRSICLDAAGVHDTLEGEPQVPPTPVSTTAPMLIPVATMSSAVAPVEAATAPITTTSSVSSTISSATTVISAAPHSVVNSGRDRGSTGQLMNF